MKFLIFLFVSNFGTLMAENIFINSSLNQMEVENHTENFMSREIEIVTVDSPNKDVLKRKTEDIEPDELQLALEIGDKLFQALKPHLPAAGLAAPQIGISKSVFLYSYDRRPENLELVINPTFYPIGDHRIEGWEGCFSIILSDSVWQLAKIPRYEKIQVSYLNHNGEKIEKILEGFAAKVFQHEYDHLQGIENIERSDAQIKEFDSRENLLKFMQDVKKEDSAHYNKPNYCCYAGFCSRLS